MRKSLAGHGAGDPLSSHRFDAIVPSARSTTLAPRALDLTPAHLARLERLYEAVCAQFGT